MASSSPDTTDGRVQRSERSRQAIIEALIALIESGSPMPTAERVAQRAGVGIRTVFRHFSDMEALFAAMASVDDPALVAFLKQQPVQGGLASRMRALLTRRAEFNERARAQWHSLQLARWRSPSLDTRAKWLVRELRKDLIRWLPEVASADREIADALEAVLSIDHWDLLRREQRLSAKRAQAALEASAIALLKGLARK